MSNHYKLKEILLNKDEVEALSEEEIQEIADALREKERLRLKIFFDRDEIDASLYPKISGSFDF